MAAPPIFAAKNQFRAFTVQADFVAAVSSSLLNPTAETARMPGAVQKFAIMPPPGVTQVEAIAVAEDLWATDFSRPDRSLTHHEEEHGEAPTQ